MEIQEARTKDQITEIYPVLKQLRSTPTLDEILSLTEAAAQYNGFKLVAAFVDRKCVAVMGYRVLYDFTHGKHLYIDDLVVDVEHRSKGVGESLIRHAEELAQKLECRGLRLCTGVDNVGAQKFYRRCSWEQRAVVFKKKLVSS